MNFNTITINFDTQEEQQAWELKANNLNLGCLWEHDTDELWTEWSIDACTVDDLKALFSVDSPDNDIVTITCYGQKTTMTRQEALEEYREAMRCCEGSERERYCNIVMDLEDGKTECSDGDE